MGESNRFAEIYPPFLGYYVQGKKSYFDRRTNIRSKKKELSDIEHHIPEGTTTYTYAGIVNAGITAVPLPDTALPDTASICFNGIHAPIFKKDQNTCIYIVSKTQQYVSFNFALGQTKAKTPPIPQDNEKIIFDHLTAGTAELVKKLS